MKEEAKLCLFYVYRHIRIDTNQVFYIGIGIKYKNKYVRVYDTTNRNKFWRNVVNKTDYKVEIIFDNITWEEAKRKEIRLIKLYGRRDLKQGSLVNLTNGGDGSVGGVLSEEHKQKISNFQLGRVKSEETRKKLSLKHKGKKLSEEHIKNMSKSRKGLIVANHEKPVICTKTGQIFRSIKVAAPYSGFSKSFLAAMLRGEKENKTTLIYYKN